MKLEEIQLELIDSEYYSKLHSKWYNTRKQPDIRRDYAHIINPFKFTSYERLLEEFLENPYADQISVRAGPKRWEKFYARKIVASDISLIVKLAEEDRIRISHLELYFKDKDVKRKEEFNPERKDRIEIKFAERGQIIGYHIIFPIEYSDFFTWKDESPKKSIIFCLAE